MYPEGFIHISLNHLGPRSYTQKPSIKKAIIENKVILYISNKCKSFKIKAETLSNN